MSNNTKPTTITAQAIIENQALLRAVSAPEAPHYIHSSTNAMRIHRPVLSEHNGRLMWSWQVGTDLHQPLDACVSYMLVQPNPRTEVPHERPAISPMAEWHQIAQLSHWTQPTGSHIVSSIAFTMGQWLADLGRFGETSGSERFTLRYTTDQSEYRRFNLLQVGARALSPGAWLDIKELIPFIKEVHPEIWTTTADITIGFRDGKVAVDTVLSYPV